jgi:hypothetical protein
MEGQLVIQVQMIPQCVLLSAGALSVERMPLHLLGGAESQVAVRLGHGRLQKRGEDPGPSLVQLEGQIGSPRPSPECDQVTRLNPLSGPMTSFQNPHH